MDDGTSRGFNRLIKRVILAISYTVGGGGGGDKSSLCQWIPALPLNHLTHLTLRIGKPGIDIIRIVEACSKLVHLSYELADNGTGTLTPDLQMDFIRYCSQQLPPSTILSLRSLCVKSSLLDHYEKRLLSTLIRHSPHLRVISLLGLWPFDIRIIHDMIQPLNNLEYLACNVDRCSWLLNDTILNHSSGPPSSSSKIQQGLRGLILQGSPDCSPETLSFIREHQHTLQHLNLTLGFHPRYDHVVCALLGQLDMDKLETLHWSGCSSNRYGAALGIMLGHCQRLQRIELPDLDGADRQWTQALAGLKDLHTLSLGIDDPWQDTNAVMAPPHSSTTTTTEDDDDDAATVDVVLGELFSVFARQGDSCRLQNLSLKLRLGDGAMCLSLLSNIRSLRKLAIWGLSLADDQAVSQITNHISASKQMERLCLVSFRSLGRDALEHLSQLQHLRCLAIICCNQLSVIGLEQLVQTCPQLENVTVGQVHQVDGDVTTWQSIKKRLGMDPRSHPLYPSVILS